MLRLEAWWVAGSGRRIVLDAKASPLRGHEVEGQGQAAWKIAYLAQRNWQEWYLIPMVGRFFIVCLVPISVESYSWPLKSCPFKMR